MNFEVASQSTSVSVKLIADRLNQHERVYMSLIGSETVIIFDCMTFDISELNQSNLRRVCDDNIGY